jgi:hypothetical protein
VAVPAHPAENEYHRDFSDDLLGKTRAPLDEMPASTFTSSNVHSALYDYGERELVVRYKRTVGVDAIYQYTNVPAQTWRGLVEASSKGSFINREVAYEYNYAKVGRDELQREATKLQQSRVRRFIVTP